MRILCFREGCQTRLPLSRLFFVIGIEVFADAIRNKNMIKVIKVGEKEIKAPLYADDTTVFAGHHGFRATPRFYTRTTDTD